jgi:hypothetical protein
MKLINGTEMIDNSPNEKAGELAEAIYDDVLFILDIEHKCIRMTKTATQVIQSMGKTYLMVSMNNV